MGRYISTIRCGALAGLALLFASPSIADEAVREAVRQQLRDENYMLVEDQHGARLFVFSTGSITTVTDLQDVSSGQPGRSQMNAALEMTRSADSRIRVRGLTLLSGVEELAALDAALVLLFDPVAAVREEAVQLIIEHPGSDIASIVEIATHDPSSRVRQAAAELIAERSDDWGD